MSIPKSVSTNPMYQIEIQEIIEKLRDNGYGDIVDCLLENESIVYTKKGRLNKSSTCREMDWKNKQLEDTIQAIKNIVGPDLGWD